MDNFAGLDLGGLALLHLQPLRLLVVVVVRHPVRLRSDHCSQQAETWQRSEYELLSTSLKIAEVKI